MLAVPTSSLPTVVLQNRSIPPSVLQLIPLETVKKYQIAAFETDQMILKLAVVHPEQLKQGFVTAIEDLGKKVGKKVELYKTDSASLQALIRQYEQAPKGGASQLPTLVPPTLPNTPLMNEAKTLSEAPPLPPLPSHSNPVPTTPVPPRPSRVPAKPPLFEVGKTVAFNYLKRVPLEYAKAHRLVCVDFLKPNIYWFVSDGTRDKELEQVIPLIEKSNKILIEKNTIKPRELDDLLEYYAQLVKKEQENPAPVIVSSAEEVAQKEAGVTVPDDNAEVMTTVQEKEGIAGFLQRVNMTLAGSSGEEGAAKPGEPIKEEVVKGPNITAPETGISSRSAAMPAPLVQPGPNQPVVPVPSPASEVTPVAPQPVAPTATAVTPTAVTQSTKTDDETSDIGKLLEKQVESLDELKEIVKKGFIPRIVAAVVSYAIHEKASDIHIESFQDEVRIRYRIDGQLIDIIKLPPDVHAAMVSRIKILSRLRLDETRVPQDGRFDVNFEHAQVDLRVSLMPTVHGEKVVMRILDKSRGIASLEKLGIEGLGYENLTKAIQKPFGICLATGPTGSGKSTSLYAILNRIATPNVNVVTLEDPVEYEMKGINQAQIRPKIGFTFAEGLRSILRQDPNIIMVGEIRDGETANMATQAALTGHLVLSTLHTNDSAGAIPRLTNMGIEPFLIASSLNVAMGQRLVRKICPDCKKEISLPPGFKSQIEQDIHTIEELNPIDKGRIQWPLHFFQGMGCNTCGGKGYLGRVGIYEVLVMSEVVEDLTLKQASNEQIQQQAQKEGMLTMYQDGLLKVINGTTTLDEVLRETSTR